MNSIDNQKIAIVGGGPGGLTLARLLQMRGADVAVYERDVDRKVRVQGATLDLHEESGLEALRSAGLMDAFKAQYRPGADRLRIVDKDAGILFDDSETGKTDTFGDAAFRPEIDRGPLRNLLLDSLQPGTVVWDSQLVTLVPAGASWQLTFRNGTSANADVVIAADGANSKIRPLITPVRPFYSGVTIVEGTVQQSATAAPNLHQLLNGGKVFALGDEKSLIVSSKGDGSFVFYAGCKTDEDWARTSGIDFGNRAEVAAWFYGAFQDWSPVWSELFDKADEPLVPRPQYCMPLDQSWTALPNLTMVGDAAHLMPPYAGEGVNMAMQDALELSRCLTDATLPDTQTVIARYEQQMRARAAEVARITLEQTAALHSPDAIAGMLALFAEPESR